MNTTAHENRVDTIIGSLEGYAHDEYGNNLHALLEDGHTARGLIEDACYWQGWAYTPEFLADVLTAARERAGELEAEQYMPQFLTNVFAAARARADELAEEATGGNAAHA